MNMNVTIFFHLRFGLLYAGLFRISLQYRAAKDHLRRRAYAFQKHLRRLISYASDALRSACVLFSQHLDYCLWPFRETGAQDSHTLDYRNDGKQKDRLELLQNEFSKIPGVHKESILIESDWTAKFHTLFLACVRSTANIYPFLKHISKTVLQVTASFDRSLSIPEGRVAFRADSRNKRQSGQPNVAAFITTTSEGFNSFCHGVSMTEITI